MCSIVNCSTLWLGLAIVLAILFCMAAMGMSGGQIHSAGRPDEHPPGWDNRKRKR